VDEEFEVVKQVVVAIDGRLRAFSDRAIKYYVEENLTVWNVSALMYLYEHPVARLMSVSVSKLDIARRYPEFIDRLIDVYIRTWIEKMKLTREYKDLDVEFNSPPSWAKEVV
jgi:hypothetical protein